MKTSQKGINAIKHYESRNDNNLSLIGLQPKMDPKGIWTSGYGHAIVVNGKFLVGAANQALAYQFALADEAAAEKLLAIDLTHFEGQIDSLHLRLTQDQFDALVSFIYNLGFAALLGSTLLKRIKADLGPELITEAFLMWNRCGGAVLPGLTYRRQTEALLFTTGELKFFN